MRSPLKLRGLALLFVFALFAGACAAEDDASDAEPTDEAMEETEAMDDGAMEETEAAVTDSAEACDADAILAAVEGGAEEGTVAGMTDDPVATAASNNPVLTTLTTAVGAAGLGDTLNSADALTVFAPTDCAFAEFDQETLEAALADPAGLLTSVLGYHVIPGEQVGSENIAGEYTTFTEEALTVEGTTVAGQAEIVVPDIQTANATVHLIDTVLVPPSVAGE